MATLHKEVLIAAPPQQVWDAVRDLGALHTRLVPGFVVETRLEPGGDAREVTFANGMVVREPIISLDDDRRRLAWTVQGVPTTHYNAVLQVSPASDGSRVTWTTDLLPDDVAGSIGEMQEQGLAAMKKSFESRS